MRVEFNNLLQARIKHIMSTEFNADLMNDGRHTETEVSLNNFIGIEELQAAFSEVGVSVNLTSVHTRGRLQVRVWFNADGLRRDSVTDRVLDGIHRIFSSSGLYRITRATDGSISVQSVIAVKNQNLGRWVESLDDVTGNILDLVNAVLNKLMSPAELVSA